MDHCIYIIFSEKLNRFYTGYTSNFDIRMDFHFQASSNKFTAKAKDWIIYLKIPCDSKEQALCIEKHIKTMKSKTYIQNLKKYPEMISKLKFKYKNG